VIAEAIAERAEAIAVIAEAIAVIADMKSRAIMITIIVLDFFEILIAPGL
jgi:hypothetical protein